MPNSGIRDPGSGIRSSPADRNHALQFALDRHQPLLKRADRVSQVVVRGCQRVHAGAHSLFADRHRFPSFRDAVGQAAQRGVEHERPAGGVAILRVDVRGELLKVLDQARLEPCQRGELFSERVGGSFRCLLSLSRACRVAVDVIDQK